MITESSKGLNDPFFFFFVNDRKTFFFTSVEKEEMWLREKAPGGQAGVSRPSFYFCTDKLSKMALTGIRLLFFLFLTSLLQYK